MNSTHIRSVFHHCLYKKPLFIAEVSPDCCSPSGLAENTLQERSLSNKSKDLYCMWHPKISAKIKILHCTVLTKCLLEHVQRSLTYENPQASVLQCTSRRFCPVHPKIPILFQRLVLQIQWPLSSTSTDFHNVFWIQKSLSRESSQLTIFCSLPMQKRSLQTKKNERIPHVPRLALF
jgi:hypothetical protein